MHFWNMNFNYLQRFLFKIFVIQNLHEIIFLLIKFISKINLGILNQIKMFILFGFRFYVCSIHIHKREIVIFQILFFFLLLLLRYARFTHAKRKKKIVFKKLQLFFYLCIFIISFNFKWKKNCICLAKRKCKTKWLC